jgi:hypothetical protein
MSQQATIGITPTAGSRPVSTLSCAEIVSLSKTVVQKVGRGQRNFTIQIGLRNRHGFQCNQSPAPGVNKDKILFLPSASLNIQQVQSLGGCGAFTLTIQQAGLPVAFGFRVRFEEDLTRTGVIKPVKKDCQLAFFPPPTDLDGVVEYTLGDVANTGTTPDPED